MTDKRCFEKQYHILPGKTLCDKHFLTDWLSAI